MAASKNSLKTFTVKYKNEDDEVLTGTFTTKRMSIMEISKMGVRKSQLSGGMYCVRDDNTSRHSLLLIFAVAIHFASSSGWRRSIGCG